MAASNRKLAPLPMHRVATVKRASGSELPAAEQGQKPVDFLKRLEQLEAEDGGGTRPSAPAVAPGFRTDPFAPKFKSVKPRPPNGEDAEQVLKQLMEVQNSIDEIRTRQRERTPPEKHAGGAALEM